MITTAATIQVSADLLHPIALLIQLISITFFLIAFVTIDFLSPIFTFPTTAISTIAIMLQRGAATLSCALIVIVRMSLHILTSPFRTEFFTITRGTRIYWVDPSSSTWHFDLACSLGLLTSTGKGVYTRRMITLSLIIDTVTSILLSAFGVMQAFVDQQVEQCLDRFASFSTSPYQSIPYADTSLLM